MCNKYLNHLSGICSWQANSLTVFYKNVIKSVNFIIDYNIWTKTNIHKSDTKKSQELLLTEEYQLRLAEGRSRWEKSPCGNPNRPDSGHWCAENRWVRAAGRSLFPGSEVSPHRLNYKGGGNGPSGWRGLVIISLASPRTEPDLPNMTYSCQKGLT